MDNVMTEEQPDYKTRYFTSKQQLIHERYLDILKRLENGKIYGVPITLPITSEDLEVLVVAAYFAGQVEVQKEHAGRLQLPPL